MSVSNDRKYGEFAYQQLCKQGWEEGKGLGITESGIKEPIRVNLKRDNAGVGLDAGEQFSFHWWEDVYNKAVNNISVSNTEEGQLVNKIADGFSKPTTKRNSTSVTENKDLIYGQFVKSSTMKDSVEVNSDPPKPRLPGQHNVTLSAAETIGSIYSDEVLLKACGGRTAHKGARHGHSQSGKLKRILQQELKHNNMSVVQSELGESDNTQQLEDEKFTKSKEKKKKARKSSEGDGFEKSVNSEEISVKKSKKHSRVKKQTDSDFSDMDHDLNTDLISTQNEDMKTSQLRKGKELSHSEELKTSELKKETHSPRKKREVQSVDSQRERSSKRLKSDKLRQKSLQRWVENINTQKQQISQALSVIDVSTSTTGGNKRIVFNSEDEGDEISASIDDNRQSTVEDNRESTVGDKHVLFDENESGSDDQDDEQFRVRPEFEGVSGEKLMKLQMRIGQDKRFRVDGRFSDLTTLPQDPDDPPQQSTTTEHEDDVNIERMRNLNILSQIVGPQALTSDKRSMRDAAHSTQRRYDPSTAGHEKYEIKTVKKSIKSKPKLKKEPVANLPNVSKSQFYEVSYTKLETAFITTGSENEEFSFLRGRELEEEEKGDESDDDDDNIEIDINKQNITSSSEDEDYDNNHSNDTPAPSTSEPVDYMRKQIFPKSKTFFFLNDDPRLEHGPKTFCKTETDEEIQLKFNAIRPGLVEQFKNRHRSAAKKGYNNRPPGGDPSRPSTSRGRGRGRNF